MKQKLKLIVIILVAAYVVVHVLHVDVGGLWVTGKTFVMDMAAKVIPAVRGKFENTDRQISGGQVKSGTAKTLHDASQNAVKQASTFISKAKIGFVRTMRKIGIKPPAGRYVPKTYTPKKEGGEAEKKSNIAVYDNMNITQSSSLRQNFINYSMTLRGIPYVWGGTTPQPGLDCSGFVGYAAKNSIGVQLPRTARQMYTATVRIPTNELEPGDLVFFRSFGKVNHVGIYLGRYQGEGPMHGRELFINAASEGPSTGVIVSALDEPYWRRHYSSAGRFLPSSHDAAEALAERKADQEEKQSEQDE